MTNVQRTKRVYETLLVFPVVALTVYLLTLLMAPVAKAGQDGSQTRHQQYLERLKKTENLANSGRALLAQNKPKEAERKFRQALAVQATSRLSSYRHICYGLAQSLEVQGRNREALVQYREALTPRLADGSTLEQDSVALVRYGRIAEKMGSVQEATSAYQRALNSPYSNDELGSLAETPKGLTELRQTAQVASAITLYKRDEADKAIEMLQQVVKRNPKSVAYREQLVRVLEATGKTEAARIERAKLPSSRDIRE